MLITELGTPLKNCKVSSYHRMPSDKGLVLWAGLHKGKYIK